MSATALFLTSCNTEPHKTGYIDIVKIDKEYKLQQKLNARLKELEDQYAQDLFDLQNVLKEKKELIEKVSQTKKEIKQETLESFYKLKKSYEETKELKLKMINDTILKFKTITENKINKTVADYGKKNGFKYIYNPGGGQSFMYADSTLDITDKILIELNKE